MTPRDNILAEPVADEERPPSIAADSPGGAEAGRPVPASGTNAMTVDVEEHFQVSAFENQIARSDWSSIPSRVGRNVARILDLFAETGAKGTFFTLGCVAEKHPDLIRSIAASGHEIASHGYEHRRVTSQSPKQFRSDVARTKKILEDLSGQPVIGYRAPSFSMGPDTPWAHEILEEEGYRYSSSIYPISHDHYGVPAASRSPYIVSSTGFLEVPLTTVRIAGRNWPGAGGGYFRLLPYLYSRWAVDRVQAIDGLPTVFYFHPWELDPGQPRVEGLPLKSRFRHYVNLSRFEARLKRMLGSFRWSRMDEVYGEIQDRARS